jgi:hypothetical protein
MYRNPKNSLIFLFIIYDFEAFRAELSAWKLFLMSDNFNFWKDGGSIKL